MSTAIFGKTEPSIADKFRAQEELLAEHPQILRTRHRVLLGDARLMTEVADAQVHLVVTSPPYWNLKQYLDGAGAAQLGHIDDYDQFLRELNITWERCYDALVPGGRLCVVVGDVCLPRRKIGRHLVVPLHADISIACREIGFDYLTPILWYKIANAATEVEGNGAPFLGKPYEPNAIIKNDVEYILILRKPGGYRKPTTDQRLLSLIPKDDHSRWFRAIWDDIPGASRTKGHPAPFPLELSYRLINMFSFVGDTILDPFLGTGTTTEAAIMARRSSIGYEIERSYYELVKARLGQIAFDTDISFG
jgi:site-specific DNA-methyltransferase (adenine-specific)